MYKISKDKDDIASNESNISHMTGTILKYLTSSNFNGLHYRSKLHHKNVAYPAEHYGSDTLT